MIPIPINLLPKWLKDKLWMRWMFAILVIFIIVAMGLLAVIRASEEFRQGPDFASLHRATARELLDSANVGLLRYASINGHYPEIEGKYFFDSIKQYVNPSDIYVYADSILPGGDTVSVRKHAGKSFDYRGRSHTYLAAGRKDLPIIYRSEGSTSFVLYWVGENSKDELGQGDDVLFEPK